MAAATFVAFRAIAGAAGAAAFLAVSPAHANSSASADIAAPLRAAQVAKPAAGPTHDEQFRKLFASWQSLEQTNVPALAAVGDAARAGRAYLSSGLGAGLHTPALGVLAPFKSSIPSRVPLDAVRLTSGFGMRVHPIEGGLHEHKGVDLAAPIGSPVYATADGVVGRAEWCGGYGLLVTLEHGGDLETRYGHMSRLNVAAGQIVHKGDVIGFVGMTGRTTGPHLHYEVRVAGEAVNPLPYMQADAPFRPAEPAVAAEPIAR